MMKFENFSKTDLRKKLEKVFQAPQGSKQHLFNVMNGQVMKTRLK